jgi:hypothetical protein
MDQIHDKSPCLATHPLLPQPTDNPTDVAPTDVELLTQTAIHVVIDDDDDVAGNATAAAVVPTDIKCCPQQLAPEAPMQLHSHSRESLFVSCFAFKQCSADEDEYNEHHPKRVVVEQVLEALIVELSSAVFVLTEIDRGPLLDVQVKLELEFGFDHHAAEMRETRPQINSAAALPGNPLAAGTDAPPTVAAAHESPKKRTSREGTHSSRGHNLIGWNKSLFRFVSHQNCPLLRWIFPGVLLQHRRTMRTVWVVGVHLTPQTEHEELLKELERLVGSGRTHPGLPEGVEEIIVVGDLNVQYNKTFGESRVKDHRYICAAETRNALEELGKRPNAVGAFASSLTAGAPLGLDDGCRIASCESIMLPADRFQKLLSSSDHPCPVRLTLELLHTATVPDRTVRAVCLVADEGLSFGEQRAALVPSVIATTARCDTASSNTVAGPGSDITHKATRQCIITENATVRCTHDATHPCSTPGTTTGGAADLLLCPHHFAVCVGPVVPQSNEVPSVANALLPTSSVVVTDSASPAHQFSESTEDKAAQLDSAADIPPNPPPPAAAAPLYNAQTNHGDHAPSLLAAAPASNLVYVSSSKSKCFHTSLSCSHLGKSHQSMSGDDAERKKLVVCKDCGKRK